MSKYLPTKSKIQLKIVYTTNVDQVSVSEYFLQSISYANRERSPHTHPPESTGETTRTKGGSKGKLSCHMKKKNKP